MGGVIWSCWEWANQPVTVWTEWEPHRQARLQDFIPRTGLWVHWCPRKLRAGAMGTAEWSQGEESCWPWGVSWIGWDGVNRLHWMLLKETREAIKVGFNCLWSRAISFSMLVPVGGAIEKDFSEGGPWVPDALSNEEFWMSVYPTLSYCLSKLWILTS